MYKVLLGTILGIALTLSILFAGNYKIYRQSDLENVIYDIEEVPYVSYVYLSNYSLFK